MAFYFYLSTKIIMVFITKSYQDLFGVRSYINALTKGVDGMAGFICTPSVGVKLSHCTLQVGYNMQRNSEYGFGYTMGSIQMKLGYIF